MLTGFPTGGTIYEPDITNFSECHRILAPANWNQTNRLWIYSNGNNKLCQTFNSDFERVRNEIGMLIFKFSGHIRT